MNQFEKLKYETVIKLKKSYTSKNCFQCEMNNEENGNASKEPLK